MIIYMGFDDTDDKDAPIGTGRLVRNFIYSLDQRCEVVGVVRHQLPRLENIPFTSNNSSACAIIDISPDLPVEFITDMAVGHILSNCAPGSDPGLCVARMEDVDSGLVEFGKNATGIATTQKEAMKAASGIELMGLGGTNDGIIGAAAAVGLTKFGWCGRFIEYGRLRSLPQPLTIKDLNDTGIQVICVDRDPLVPLPGDQVLNATWIRPSMWGGSPMLQVRNIGLGLWEPAHGKRHKGHMQGQAPTAGAGMANIAP